MHADSRSLCYRTLSIPELLRQLYKSEWAESRDCSPFDATFQGADIREMNMEGLTNPRTFYRSYAACMVSIITIVSYL